MASWISSASPEARNCVWMVLTLDHQLPDPPRTQVIEHYTKVDRLPKSGDLGQVAEPVAQLGHHGVAAVHELVAAVVPQICSSRRGRRWLSR